MSSELEERLERALAQVAPGDTATEQAREAALAARSSGGRTPYRFGLLAAAVVAALLMTGVTLAASRTAREKLGLASPAPAPHHHRLPRGALPPGSGGFAAYGNDRLWLASPGLRISGHRYSAVELSPGALNVALGVGHDLVVRRLSDGGIAWRHHAGGRVVAAAWAPIGTEIAYVVAAHGGYQLRMIEGDGDHDRLLAPHTGAVTPSWRADSLAIAYAQPRGGIAVDDLTTGRTSVLHRPPACPLIQSSALAFAPRGSLLAASIGDGNMLVANTATGWARCRSGGYRVIGPLPPSQFAWLSSTTLVMADDQFLSVLTIDGERLSVRAGAAEPAGIMGLTVSPDGREIAVGLWQDDGVHIVAGQAPKPGGRFVILRTLRTLPVIADGPYRLSWR